MEKNNKYCCDNCNGELKKSKQNIKIIKETLKYTFLMQIISWGIFTICDEFPLLNRYDAQTLSFIASIFILLGVLVIYFIYERKIVKENKYNSTLFNISLIILWTLLTIIGIFATMILVDKNILHSCNGGWNCFLNGIEYGLFGLGMLAQSIIVIIYRIIYIVINYIKKRKKVK